VYRLCAGEIPNLRAITACLRRQKATRLRWTERAARLGAQRKQLRELIRLRLGCSLTNYEIGNRLRELNIDEDSLYRVPQVLGQLLGFTVKEDEDLKRSTRRFPGAFSPAGETKEQTQHRRREYSKPHRAERKGNAVPTKPRD
jgi:hypothetical protein